LDPGEEWEGYINSVSEAAGRARGKQ
jgi:hypothetical protein